MTTGLTCLLESVRSSTPPAERVIMTITDDTVQHQPSSRGATAHDVLYGRCSRKLHEERGAPLPRGCQEIMADAAAEFGLSTSEE